MRLVKVRVQDFRCVEDSEPFGLADVTCLVGKNESGKTALLKALYKLKPDIAAEEEYRPSSDYPKRKWRPGSPVPDDPPVLTTEWTLTDVEKADFAKRFGKGTLGDAITISKGYNSKNRYFSISVDEASLVKHLVAQVPTTDRKPLADSTSITELSAALEGIASRSEAQAQLHARLQKEFAQGVQAALEKALDAALPTFLYFDQYASLPGQLSLSDFTARKNASQLTDKDRLFLALVQLAGTTVEALVEAQTFEEFNSALRGVSNQISDMIFRYWSQNRHLDVDIRLDHARPGDPAPYNTGWVFRTRIENRRHRADTNFDERSTGFVWFFSFLTWFYRLKDQYGKNLIILLDEPGLSLHAKAQADLLRYFNVELRPNYQVIYTTHSPFMIDADELLSARTVEDVVVKDKATGEEKLLGTKVGENVLSTDADTISPLQRALGYEMTQTLFIGRHTLLVEGPSDMLFLKWFSRQLEKAGKVGLDYRWNISVVGGVDRIPGFISLFKGNNLHVAAVVDVQVGDKQKIANAKKALADKHLVTADSYAGQTEADIEDVLGRDFYLALVTKALDLRSPNELPASKPQDAPDRVAKEVDLFCATLPPHYREFNHFVPSEWLFQHGDDGATLPGFGQALGRMEKLIADLNALMA